MHQHDRHRQQGTHGKRPLFARHAFGPEPARVPVESYQHRHDKSRTHDSVLRCRLQDVVVCVVGCGLHCRFPVLLVDPLPCAHAGS